MGESGVPEADGPVYKWLHDPAHSKKYEHFLPFFGALIRILQLGLLDQNIHMMKQHQQENAAKIRELKIQMNASKAIEEMAGGYLNIAREAPRMRGEEL
jgi:hypothetical protein